MRRIHFLPANMELTISNKEAKTFTITKVLSAEPIDEKTFSSLILTVTNEIDSVLLYKPFSSCKRDSEIEDIVYVDEVIKHFNSANIKIISPRKGVDLFIEFVNDSPEA